MKMKNINSDVQYNSYKIYIIYKTEILNIHMCTTALEKK